MPQVVGAELELEAVLGAAQRRDHHAGVVDEQVDGLPAQSVAKARTESRLARSSSRTSCGPGPGRVAAALSPLAASRTASRGPILAVDDGARRHGPATLPARPPRGPLLDRASLDSVRAFATDWARASVDLLINNASVMISRRSAAPRTTSTPFGTDGLGPSPRRSSAPRPCSCPTSPPGGHGLLNPHRQGHMDFDDLNWNARSTAPGAPTAGPSWPTLLFTARGARLTDAAQGAFDGRAPGYAATDAATRRHGDGLRHGRGLRRPPARQETTTATPCPPYTWPRRPCRRHFAGPSGFAGLRAPPPPAPLQKASDDAAARPLAGQRGTDRRDLPGHATAVNHQPKRRVPPSPVACLPMPRTPAG